MLRSVMVLPLLLLLSSVDVLCVSGECSDTELDTHKTEFKECMELQQPALLSLNETVDGVQEKVCDGLGMLVVDCREVVTRLSTCMGREKVDQLVAIHLSSLTQILSLSLPSVEFDDCEVFQPQVSKMNSVESNEIPSAQVEPQYITGSATVSQLSSVTALAALVISRWW